MPLHRFVGISLWPFAHINKSTGPVLNMEQRQ